MPETELYQAIRAYELLLAPLQSATTLAESMLAADAGDRLAGELLDKCDTVWELVIENGGFFERELAELPADGDSAERLNPGEYGNYTRLVRDAAERVPPAATADLLTRLDPVPGWERHARTLLARITVADGAERISLGAALPSLYHPDGDHRERRCAAISAALAPEVELRAAALAELTRARLARQRVCGQAGWLAEENAANQLTGAEVATLSEAVADRRDLVHRYYSAKAEALGHPLTEADRYAPVGTARASEAEVSWADAADLVLGAFAGLGREVADAAACLFAEGAVDAAPRRGKRRGALTFSLPGGGARVLLNFTGVPRDVLTLAHELGHAVHTRLSGHHGVLTATPPTVLAETVALFAEAVTMRHYHAQAEPGTREGLRARWLEDQLVAAFRQLAVHDFETSLNERVAAGESPDETALGDLWLDGQRALYGPALTLGPGYRHWWSYLDNLYFAPGTRYAYAFGQLAANSLLALHDEDPAGFTTRFTALLRAGGSGPPAELLGRAGLRLDERGWRAGLSELDLQVTGFAERAGKPRTPALR